MVDQLVHLIGLMDNPRISFGIVPLDADFRAPAAGFVIHDDTEASAEAVGGEIIVNDPDGIALHARTFEILAGQAVYEDDAKRLIETAVAEHQSR